MIALLREASRGVSGVLALLAFRENWRSFFDVSASGLVRSFGAAILSIPLIIFVLHGYARIGIEAGAPGAAPPGLSDMLAAWARIWLVFPLAALPAVIIFGRRRAWAPWVVVHNWTVLALLGVQALVAALYLAGLAGAEAVALFLFAIYAPLRYVIHWRVAMGALALHPVTALAAAAIPVLADLLVVEAMVRLAASPGAAQ